MNGYSSSILVALGAYLVSGLAPENFARETLAITVGILSFAVMDLRREWRAARRELSRQGQATQYLLGAMAQIAPRVNVNLPIFKWPEE